MGKGTVMNVIEKYFVRKQWYYRFLGRGLVTVTHYDDWSPRRRLYDPAFTKRLRCRVVKKYVWCHNHDIVHTHVVWVPVSSYTQIPNRYYNIMLSSSALVQWACADDSGTNFNFCGYFCQEKIRPMPMPIIGKFLFMPSSSTLICWLVLVSL